MRICKSLNFRLLNDTYSEIRKIWKVYIKLSFSHEIAAYRGIYIYANDKNKNMSSGGVRGMFFYHS